MNIPRPLFRFSSMAFGSSQMKRIEGAYQTLLVPYHQFMSPFFREAWDKAPTLGR